MEPKEKSYVLLKPEKKQRLHAVMYVENYFPVVIIDVRKPVMMDRVQNVPSYRKIARHVLVERASWTINNEHHVLIR